jgi:hypothetical protein
MGLHSSTVHLKVSSFYGIGGVNGVLMGVIRVLSGNFRACEGVVQGG